jgi:hypothetical protein
MLEIMETLVACPACGEPTAITLDDESGRQTFIQDCDVCCRPMQIRARITDDGELELDAERA